MADKKIGAAGPRKPIPLAADGTPVETGIVIPKEPEELKEGEAKYVAKVLLRLNYGRLTVEPGMTVILGPEDCEQGINVQNLEYNQGIERFSTQDRADEIRQEWLDVHKPRRDDMRNQNAGRRGRRR